MDTETSAIKADILIVDDKLENIRFLSDFLSGHHYQVRKAINGKTALIAAKALPPDLIFLDVNMPDMEGYEVCKILKSDPQTQSIPVIFLSAGSAASDKVKAFQAGGIDYITKPFQLDEILVRVETQLSIQNLQRQLQEQNDQLQTTLRSMQAMQAQLVQKEKLVNACRIAAGIAHEINNPLSFILGNLQPVSDYSQTFLALMGLYRAALPQETPEIKKFILEHDVDFISQDFIKIIQSIKTGAERIHSVVRAINVFSRLDESGIKPINVCACLDSVLMLLQSQLLLDEQNKSQICIHKHYDDQAVFLGHANLFNQALLNLIQNAIEAVKSRLELETEPAFQPTITITVEIMGAAGDPSQIEITIQDNGIGIAAEHQPHLFEPFFTTKSVGEGVGLGLFTSHQIITDLHKGALTYSNCPDGGSKFIIELAAS